MKGIVFNLLEEVVRRQYGEDAWDEMLDRANVRGSYTSLGSYSDDDMTALLGAASQMLAMPAGDVLRWFGREAMADLAARYPVFFEPHRSARTFVLSVNSIIHPEVRKLYPGSICPHFDFEESADGMLAMTYRSPRHLCQLAHGFIEGASAHYGETVDCRHSACTLRGDERCRFEIRWGRERAFTCTAA